MPGLGTTAAVPWCHSLSEGKEQAGGVGGKEQGVVGERSRGWWGEGAGVGRGKVVTA